jgi:hypothetical protein
LKELLTGAPILKITYTNENYVVCTNACKEGLGGVLTQNGHVISYDSRKLKEHEGNYTTYDLELDVIVHALKTWRHYLMGKKFELRIDDNGLKYLFEQSTLNARKTRWLEFLSEHDFDINHIKGKEKKFIDALNIRVHIMHATTISVHNSYLKSIILDVVITYQHYI